MGDVEEDGRYTLFREYWEKIQGGSRDPDSERPASIRCLAEKTADVFDQEFEFEKLPVGGEQTLQDLIEVGGFKFPNLKEKIFRTKLDSTRDGILATKTWLGITNVCDDIERGNLAFDPRFSLTPHSNQYLPFLDLFK